MRVTAPPFPPGIIACRNLPAVYVTIPKSACTTIKNLLYQIDTGTAFADPPAIHKAIRNGLVPDTFVTRVEDLDPFIRNRNVSFTFVRNPLARIYSCFNDKIYFESQYSFPRLRQRYLPDKYGITFEPIEAGYSLSRHSDNFRRFLLFVRDNVSDRTAVRKDGHWLPQSALIRRYSEKLPIDVIGKVESYEADMRVVLDRIGKADRRELLGVKFNEGLPAPFPLEDILTGEIRELVADIYSEDYLTLDYHLHL